MMERYSESRELVPCDDGRWCLYEDAQKRIAELEERIKHIKWLIGPISGRVSNMIYQECVISEGGADDTTD